MNTKSNNLEVLSSRAGFNSAVRYMNQAISVASSLEHENLGDIVFDLEGDEINANYAAFLLKMLLVDKYGYKFSSANLESVTSNLPSLAAEFAKWKGVDLVAAYHHPDLGLLIANPKAEEQLECFKQLRRDELITVYAGKRDAPIDVNCQKAADLAIKLFEGVNAKIPPELLKGNFTVRKKAAPNKEKNNTAKKEPVQKTQQTGQVKGPAAPEASKGKLRMTPMYSVAVTNELFHNGNVEAWKRIIDSYNEKYPDLKVNIYYEGERIFNINSLFKWGKVKHGSSILFSVSGNDIKDVAKLQRYLIQGASNMFEAFLRASVSATLKLFG